MSLSIAAVDLKNLSISAVWLDLLDHYALDPMGGGEGLSAYAKAHLVEQLKTLPTFHGALAFLGEKPVGLINCFAGFSTFAAPLPRRGRSHCGCRCRSSRKPGRPW